MVLDDPVLMIRRKTSVASRENAQPTLARLLDGLSTIEGFGPTCLPEVGILRATRKHSSEPVSYDPCILIVAQGRVRGRLGNHSFGFDARKYLVLAMSLPFECQAAGTLKAPMLGMSVRVTPATVAELLLEEDAPPASEDWAHTVDATPISPDMSDAVLRLAKCLRSPVEARILGPQIIREITYWAVREGQGGPLRALVSPQSKFGQVARALNRIHLDFAQPLDVSSLAREVAMSVSTFYATFKAVTSSSPQRYLQTVRLQKAQVLIVAGASVADAARRVGYESPTQFSREFKRLFGRTPKELASRSYVPFSMSWSG